jgi:chromosome segregation ATPase
MSSPQEILLALRTLEDNLTQRLTAEMDRRFVEFGLEMNGRFDAIEAKFERLNTEYQMITAALRRIEERLEAHDSERLEMRTKLAELKARVVKLNEHVRALEAKLED